jgi:hypothetical protein
MHAPDWSRSRQASVPFQGRAPFGLSEQIHYYRRRGLSNAFNFCHESARGGRDWISGDEIHSPRPVRVSLGYARRGIAWLCEKPRSSVKWHMELKVLPLTSPSDIPVIARIHLAAFLTNKSYRTVWYKARRDRVPGIATSAFPHIRPYGSVCQSSRGFLSRLDFCRFGSYHHRLRQMARLHCPTGPIASVH